jgi:hypothetical protein
VKLPDEKEYISIEKGSCVSPSETEAAVEAGSAAEEVAGAEAGGVEEFELPHPTKSMDRINTKDTSDNPDLQRLFMNTFLLFSLDTDTDAQ